LSDDVSVVVVDFKPGAVTVWIASEPVLGLTFASPLYDAVTVCGPAVSVDVTNCGSALPPTSASGKGECAWPSMVNETLPVGMPWNPGALTTAVKVTCWPSVDGLADEVTVVMVADNPTTPTMVENCDVSPSASVVVAE
jgi:hypothetical protein